MFCGKCGAKMADSDRFCVSCGASLESMLPSSVSSIQAAEPMAETYEEDEEIIDLSNLSGVDAPQEKKHKGTIVSVIILALVWVAYAFLVSAFADASGIRKGDETVYILLTIACVCVPFTVIGLPITLIAKKIAGPMKKLQNGQYLIFLMFSCLITAMAVATGFADAMASIGSLVRIVSVMMMAAFLVSYVIVVILASGSNGKEGMFGVLTAFFISFIPAIFLGYLIAKIFAAVAVLIVVGVIGMILFFANGGIIIYRRN